MGAGALEAPQAPEQRQGEDGGDQDRNQHPSGKASASVRGDFSRGQGEHDPEKKKQRKQKSPEGSRVEEPEVRKIDHAEEDGEVHDQGGRILPEILQVFVDVVELAVKGALADAERLGRLAAVAVESLQGAADELLFRLLQGR